MGQKRTLPSRIGDPGLHLITNGVMTGTNVILSSDPKPIGIGQPFNLQNLDNIGLQVSWTGTPVGIIEVLCSIDNVNFLPLTFNPALAQPAGAPGAYLIDLTQVAFPYLTFRYTNTSGSGVLNVWLCAKDLN
jgi:hypothetical protein